MSAIAQLLPTTNQVAAEEALELCCHCQACEAAGDVPQVRGLQRMPLPPREDLIRALLATRDWVLDPDSPKVQGLLAARPWPSAPPGDVRDDMQPVPVCSAEATHWCAIGFLGKQLGINDAGALCDTIAAHYYSPAVPWIWQRFDAGEYEQCARICHALAIHIQQCRA